MLRPDWKQNLILLVFTILMFDVMTVATMCFVAGGLLLVLLNIKTTKLIRNILALGVFASYWITYGKLIDPEVGLNFLVSIIVLKILEKETVRDRYMIFFGLLLLISAGSLFERTLTYVFFFGASFLILIRDFYSYLGQKWRLKDLGLALIWVLPLTFMLFFFVPRLLNPIPFQSRQNGPGEIGYTPDVNVSQIESLTGNNDPVFQVVSSQSLKQNELYWRGNTLSYNDGWNWTKMPEDSESPEPLLGAGPGKNETRQKIRTFGKSEYFFALDYPRVISYGRNIFGLGSLGTLAQSRWSGVQRYEAISGPRKEINELVPGPQYLRVNLSKRQKQKIEESFSGSSLSEVEASIRTHFLKNKFSYSLSPGRSSTLQEFMSRKVGLCSHYASAVGLILRVKGIPTRLVSGFMGGAYNRFADFYMISQNDAHVWVEAFYDGKWSRLDPTEWIAPDRVQLGGEAFIQNVKSSESSAFKSLFKAPKFVQDMKLWFGQWDFMFYQWLEDMDYYSQDALLSRFNFKREWLFSVIPLLMVVFMLAYSWYLATRNNGAEDSEMHELWRIFHKKMLKKGLKLSLYSVEVSADLIRNQNNPEVSEVWDALISGSFKGQDINVKGLRQKIRRL